MNTAEKLSPSKINGSFPFDYQGTGMKFTYLVFKNIFLRILTLGLYSPVAKTSTRRYVWGNVFFMGDRAIYTGTPREVSLGFFMTFGFIATFLLASAAVSKYFPKFSIIFGVVFSIGLIVIKAHSTFSSYRYKLSRTQWRQIHFSLSQRRANAKDFVSLSLEGTLITILTLGLYYPFFKNQTIAYLTNRTKFGDYGFHYTASNWDYARKFYVGFLLSVITMGLYSPVFLFNMFKFRLEHTHFQGASLQCSLSSTRFFFKVIGYFLATLFTVGLAGPQCFNSFIETIISNITFDGSFHIESINQPAEDSTAPGARLAVVTDSDFGM